MKLKYTSVFVICFPSPEGHLTLQLLVKMFCIDLCTSLTSALGTELSDLPVVFQLGKKTLSFLISFLPKRYCGASFR